MYDEPTAGLDPVASTVVEDLIRELHEKHGEGHHHEVGAWQECPAAADTLCQVN